MSFHDHTYAYNIQMVDNSFNMNYLNLYLNEFQNENNSNSLK